MRFFLAVTIWMVLSALEQTYQWEFIELSIDNWVDKIFILFLFLLPLAQDLKELTR